ncbi:MAG: sel1 repeat family protein [Candidatus Riflebacteria bacterium]|nr:sel1 repeat family protein [Candidatus Riflebacteria bacterium]
MQTRSTLFRTKLFFNLECRIKFILLLFLIVASCSSVSGNDDFAIAERAFFFEDYGMARELFQKYAKDGNLVAQIRLGVMYYRGLGVKKDHAEALKWLMLAAQQGRAEAQYLVGEILFEPQTSNVKASRSEAFVWYNKAADQGFDLAIRRMAICYDLGEGIPKDYVKAFNWYLRGAELGDFACQYCVGVMYEEGNGTEKNLIEAYKWFHIVTFGVAPSMQKGWTLLKRDILKSSMKPEEIAEARRLADAWLNKK